jgi:hypothetical protein
MMPKKASYYVGFVSGMIAVALVIGAVVAGSAGLNNWLAAPDASWAAWIFKQKQNLIREPGSSRLIIVAGSNGLFGISAADLERRTGRDVINAATHAGLGYNFYDVNLLGLIRPGDIVLMPLENGMYYDEDKITSLVVQAAHQVGRDYLVSLNLNQKIEYLRLLNLNFIFEQYRQFLFAGKARKIYDKVSQNGYWQLGVSRDGDIDIALATPNPRQVVKQAKSYQSQLPAKSNMAKRERLLCDSIQEMVRRGVHVIGTPDNMYMPNLPAVDERREVLKKASILFRRCGGEWLDVANDGLQPLDRMLDTPFHLNAEGRRLRTEELASALCEKIILCSTRPAERVETEVSK